MLTDKDFKDLVKLGGSLGQSGMSEHIIERLKISSELSRSSSITASLRRILLSLATKVKALKSTKVTLMQGRRIMLQMLSFIILEPMKERKPPWPLQLLLSLQ